jgi:hypothetical protein
VGESLIWVSRVTGECAALDRERVVCGAGRLVLGGGGNLKILLHTGGGPCWDPPVAPAGYSFLPRDPQRVMGAAAELAAAVHGLTVAPPAESDVFWEQLPWAFMATAEVAVATAEEGSAERPDHWASMDRRWRGKGSRSSVTGYRRE